MKENHIKFLILSRHNILKMGYSLRKLMVRVVKALAWIASSKRDFLEFPINVRKEMDLVELRLNWAQQLYRDWMASKSEKGQA